VKRKPDGWIAGIWSRKGWIPYRDGSTAKLTLASPNAKTNMPKKILLIVSSFGTWNKTRLIQRARGQL
jgi:hypothetical protein